MKNSVNNYRAISISPVLSKIFEQCILDRYSKYFLTSSDRFGFKKGLWLQSCNIFSQEGCRALQINVNVNEWWLNCQCLSVRSVKSI